MRTILLVLSALLLLGLAAGRADADFSTPWVEGTKVGDVVTAHAWVIATNPELSSYGVVAMTDTMQPVLIRATADKNIVDPAALGRWAKVKARVTSRAGDLTVTVQILEVALIPPAPPAATQKANP